jgi:DNA mismatch repair protein MutL
VLEVGVPKIHVLPPGLVNQIAAGEVVERPASVVKELCENALDAGARTIAVDIEDGGLVLVRVADDGAGMDHDDALLALERHATSKLRDAEGLATIATMGFRGEAVPAIASVSRFRLDTSPGEDGAGTRILVEGGALLETSPVARTRGTTVEVRDLFFNTPARRKFMRAAATEAGHVSEALTRLALARSDVGFTLRSGGRVLLSSRAGELLSERVAQAIGREVARHFVAIDATRGEVRVHGVVTSPDHSQATSRSLYLFVNGRYFRDRSASHAVLRAYAGVLPHGRHPGGVLFVELPLDRVDVNVHPQKLEVRFAEARSVQDAIHHAVSSALRTAPWLGRGGAGSARPGTPPTTAAGGGEPHGGAVAGAPGDPLAAEEVASVLSWARAIHPPLESGALLPFPPSPPGASQPLPFTAALHGEPSPPLGYFGSLRYLGQHVRTYLLCEAPGGALVIIDQHASHERLLFHRLQEAQRLRQVRAQSFLVPQVVTLPGPLARSLEAHLAELAALGLDLEPFGGDAFAVKGAPALLGGLELPGLLTDLAQQLEQLERGSALDEALHGLAATMACHAAVRANQELTPQEARALLDGLDAVDFKARCPHGRPVVFELPLAELEKKVGRR